MTIEEFLDWRVLMYKISDLIEVNKSEYLTEIANDIKEFLESNKIKMITEKQENITAKREPGVLSAEITAVYRWNFTMNTAFLYRY